MSPRPRDPAVRTRLVTAAARVLAEEGPPALTVRRLSRETATSTMSIYTHFGSMDELRREVRRDGFTRLEAALDAVPTSGDPVTDLAAAGEVYFDFGVSDPHRYRAMFVDRPLDDDAAGTPTFDRLVTGVRACIDAGRLPADITAAEVIWAAQLWSMRHGMVSMTLTGVLPIEQARLVLTDMTYRLLVGYGDTRDAARASLDQAVPA